MPPPPSAHTLACFELEDGQEGFLRQQLGELALHSTPLPLGPDTVHLAQGAALVSVFIRSHVNAALLAELPELRFARPARPATITSISPPAGTVALSSVTSPPMERTPWPSIPSV